MMARVGRRKVEGFHSFTRWMASGGMAAVVLLTASLAEARPFRVAQIPNGAVNSCLTCHLTVGGPRNPFGITIEFGFLDGFGNVLWGPALAAIDSDGDGRSNGLELRDPAGTWVAGQPDPGTPALVTMPGVVDAPPAVPAMPLGVLALFGGVLALLGATLVRRKEVGQAAALVLATSAALGGTACSSGESAARKSSEGACWFTSRSSSR